jgi:hypothetical protein
MNRQKQGEYASAQPFCEKALEIRRRLLIDDHPDTARVYNTLACNLSAQAKYAEARDRWLDAVNCQDRTRLRFAFTGLGRTGKWSARPALAAVLARLGQPWEAAQALEEDLGRGLLDELAARADRRHKPDERDRLRKLTNELERLDRLGESAPRDLDKAERAKRFNELKRQRELTSIALGEFQSKLVKDYGTLAGQVSKLKEIQGALSADAALVTWVDGLMTNPPARMRPTLTASTGAWSSARAVFRHGWRSAEPVRMGSGPRKTPGWRSESGRRCEAELDPRRPLCSTVCALSVSSHWPRP